MIENHALRVEGQVDDVRRLCQNPPVEWDGETAWSTHDGPGGLALLESAIISCPNCDQRAFWRNGFLRCEGCEKQRLIG
jgi:hypothetical protein